MTHKFQVVVSLRPKPNKFDAAIPTGPLGTIKRFLAGLLFFTLSAAMLIAALLLGWLMLAFLGTFLALAVVALIINAAGRRRT